jgi:hypothetical protein
MTLTQVRSELCRLTSVNVLPLFINCIHKISHLINNMRPHADLYDLPQPKKNTSRNYEVAVNVIVVSPECVKYFIRF